METLVVLLGWFACGWICSMIAESKGYDKGTAWAVGIIFGVFGILYYGNLKDKTKSL